MAVVDQPTSHREELGSRRDRANREFANTAVLIRIGAPVAASLSGVVSAMFSVHVALGAFWFGLDFVFKFVLGPSLDAAPMRQPARSTTGSSRNWLSWLNPSVSVWSALASVSQLLGYWASPSILLWGALVIGALMLV